MKNLVLINQHQLTPPPVTGGIEKRIKIFLDYLEASEFPISIIDVDNIHKLNEDNLAIGFNLNNDVLKYLDYKNIKCINTICGGFAQNERNTNSLFSSKNIKIRFLSESNRKDHDGTFEEKNSFILPHGIGPHEFLKPRRKNKYFLWTASLGWGMQAKGLDKFIQLAYHNPDYDFLAYGGRWNSEALESNLVKYDSSEEIPNFKIKFDLKDEDKNYVYENAIALCQFTVLKEAGNTTTLEAMARECPVITLDVNNGSVDEYLGEFNFKLKNHRLDEKFVNWILDFDFEKYKERALEFRVAKEAYGVLTAFK